MTTTTTVVNFWEKWKNYEKIIKQECIPTGRVLSAAVAVLGKGVCPSGCLPRRVSAHGVSAWTGVLPKGQVSVHGGYTPSPMDRQTPVKHYLSTTTVADSNKHIATDEELSNVPTTDKVVWGTVKTKNVLRRDKQIHAMMITKKTLKFRDETSKFIDETTEMSHNR